MMALSTVHARMKRKKIEEFAGNEYLHVDNIQEQIPCLKNHNEEQFLFGLYSSAEIWTVLSVNYLFAAYEGSFATLRLDTETDTVYEYFQENDFSSQIHLEDGRSIWVKSPELCSLMLNVMLLLKKIPCGTQLKE